MKSFALVCLALLASADAYTMPTMATRAVGRKTAVKSATKTVAKKNVVAKKVVAKKVVATKKVATKKVVAKKVVAKKVPTKKVFAKKVVEKKVVAKKPAKKLFAKKVVEKKVVEKKVVAKKPAKKLFAKKVVAKKVVAKKVVAKKPVRKAFVKKTATKKVVAKKVVGGKSRSPPSSKDYISLGGASKIAFNVKSSGRAPPKGYQQPNYADARLQIARDPAVWAAAAKTRTSPISGANIDYVYDDGLTAIETKQKASLPGFLTGSAKSQIDVTAIRDDVTADDLLFGLDTDRFQLLFIAVFGLFTLVGCLSGTVQL